MSKSNIGSADAGSASAGAAESAYQEFPAEAIKVVYDLLFGRKLNQSTSAIVPKVRSTTTSYQTGGELGEPLKGTNRAVLTKKGPKTNHLDPDDIYYCPTLFKIYEPEDRAHVSIREVLANYLYYLANSHVETREPTKTFLAKGEDGISQVGVRFHKDLTSLFSLEQAG